MQEIPDVGSVAIEAFGEVSESLPIPEVDDSNLAEWAAEYLFGDLLCYNKAFGWMFFNGIHWAPIDEVVVIEYIRIGVESLREKAILSHASSSTVGTIRSLARKAKLKSAADLVKGIVFKKAELFDADKDIVVTLNGVLDLEKGELLPHSPKFLVTKVAGAKYMPKMTHPDIDMMLSALETNEVKWLQGLFGQGLSGRTTPDDKLVLFYGGGSNGKSVLVNSVIKAAGDYAVFLPEKTLMANKSDHSTEKMPLRGARLAFIEELPEGGILPVKRLKDLVGTPQMTARSIGADNVTWDASHTLFISTNYLPVVIETDTGTWRRLRVLPFKKRFVSMGMVRQPSDVIGDPTIKTRIPENETGQLDALLSWILEGALDFYKAGKKFTLPDPVSVEMTTEMWRKDYDPLLQFFLTYVERDENSHIASVDLLAAFNNEQSRLGGRDWSQNKFNKRVTQHEELESYGLGNGPSRRRQGSGLASRPEMTEFLKPILGAQYSAWNGIKFRTVVPDSE